MSLVKKRSYSLFYAWILLLVFTASHISKSLDLHLYQNISQTSKTQKVYQNTDIKPYCSICHFIWLKSESAKNIIFTSILIGILIAHYEIKEITVWRPVSSVNAHSPPTF